jgi:hypothetical protein
MLVELLSGRKPRDKTSNLSTPQKIKAAFKQYMIKTRVCMLTTEACVQRGRKYLVVYTYQPRLNRANHIRYKVRSLYNPRGQTTKLQRREYAAINATAFFFFFWLLLHVSLSTEGSSVPQVLRAHILGLLLL